jgi:hypothetical protein
MLLEDGVTLSEQACGVPVGLLHLGHGLADGAKHEEMRLCGLNGRVHERLKRRPVLFRTPHEFSLAWWSGLISIRAALCRNSDEVKETNEGRV